MLKQSKNFKVNYASRIFRIETIRKHANADRLQCVTLMGNNLITGLDAKAGDIYVYFALESAINKEFLAYTDSFEDKTLNRNPEKKGYFSSSGRVKAVKLREEKSEGYMVPLADFTEWLQSKGVKFKFTEDMLDYDFDMVGEIEISRKYFVEKYLNVPKTRAEKKNAKLARFERLIQEQFRLHLDTSHLGRNIHKIQPDSLISISNKIHGSSWVVGNVLCNRKLSWKEKIAKYFGAKVVEQEYDTIYASRTVVKNRYVNENQGHGFYGEGGDIWEVIAQELKPILPKGITLYGEVVGFTPNGRAIQKNYDYGCLQGEHKIFVYRVTSTNADGKVIEFTFPQVQDFCRKYGLNHVPVFYYGYAGDLFPELNADEHWHENFIQRLSDTFLEKKCDMCRNDVWAEGIVLRLETGELEPFKHKSFNFKNYESKMLDAGESDLESEQAEEVEETAEN